MRRVYHRIVWRISIDHLYAEPANQWKWFARKFYKCVVQSRCAIFVLFQMRLCGMATNSINRKEIQAAHGWLVVQVVCTADTSWVLYMVFVFYIVGLPPICTHFFFVCTAQDVRCVCISTTGQEIEAAPRRWGVNLANLYAATRCGHCAPPRIRPRAWMPRHLCLI